MTIYGPTNVFGWTNLATTLSAIKKFSEADKIMKKVLKDFPNESRTWQSMAIIEIHRGDLSNALKYVNKSITIDSKSKSSVMSHLIKADICLNKKLFGQAKKSIEEAIRIKPDSIRAWELKNELVHSSQRQIISKKILEILKKHNLQTKFRVDSVRLSTDIESIEAGKNLAARRFLNFLKDLNIELEKFYAFGDSISDIQMAQELFDNGQDVTFIFVGGREMLKEKYPFEIVYPQKLFDDGVVEFMSANND